ncbi:MAG: VOC family protein [Nocardioides sp.]|nr:VOC family protein [Nocardioides sp.]
MRVLRAMPLLTVDDLDATVDVYVQVSGMEVIMNHGWIATLAPADGDRSVQLSLITQDATAPTNPSASIEVDDVDGCYQAALAAGVEIVYGLSDEEWGVRRFFFRDPAGNVVNVLSHL